jgi:hypothetical protein
MKEDNLVEEKVSLMIWSLLGVVAVAMVALLWMLK